MLSNTNLDEKAELIFDLYDFDGSKYISRDELTVLMTNASGCLAQMQKKKAPTVNEIEYQVDTFFKQYDTNNDDKITLKEWKRYVKTDPEILSTLFSYGLVTREDLGGNHGGEDGLPEHDSDLDAELNPEELSRDPRINRARDGVEYVVKEETGESGGLFEEEEVDEGDQFMAVKPWQGVVDNSVPSDYQPGPNDSKAPDANLDLEFVYGYRCHDTRNNLRYTSNDHFVFHTAAVGIVMDPKANTQKYHWAHKDDIRSMAIHKDGTLVATGEIGPKPLISIWSTETMQSVATFNSDLKKGIMHLEFSPSGKYLAASAYDDEHCVAIYEKQKPGSKKGEWALYAKGKGTRAKILDMVFSPDETTLVCTAVKEVQFISFSSGNLKNKKGTGWGTGARSSVMCCEYIGQKLVTGVHNGTILTWAGTKISGKPIKAHAKACTSICKRSANPGFMTGGDDGKVIIWNDKLEKQSQIDLHEPSINSYNPKVKSVCENSSGTKILVGTRGGEIIEFTDKKSQIHLRSHSEGELWGLACHPNQNTFFTVGQENMLAIWDIKSRRQLKFARLDCPADAVEFSNDSKFIAIGYHNGQVTILDANTFAIKSVRRDRKKQISEIKFNRQVTTMAVGAHDSQIFLYNVEKNFKPIRKLKGHSSTILHIDWAEDGKNLKSVDQGYEILFFSTDSSKNIGSGASTFRDEQWFTNTAKLGWHQNGIWPPCSKGSDIQSCDRSPNFKVLATADDFGNVKLFRYPCPQERSNYQKYPGHSSHVTKVRFHKNCNYLFSTGGNDKAIFQWKFHMDDEMDEDQEKAGEVDLEGAEDGDQNAGLFEEEEVDEGDQMLCMNPLESGDIIPPSDYQPSAKEADVPEGNLTLRFAHGFRSFDTRDNLKYTGEENKIVYTTAALGVVLDTKKREQSFFTGHDDDIVCMDIHPDKTIVATGQMAHTGKAKRIDLNVWSIADGKLIQKLDKFHLRAIRTCKFSPNGSKLMSTGEDNDHSVAIWDWQKGRLLASAKVDGAKVYATLWLNDQEFITCGQKHFKMWNHQGSRLDHKKGLFGDAGGLVPLLSATMAWGKVFTGTSKGRVLEWAGRKALKNTNKIQGLPKKCGIWALHFNGQHLICGADNGTIHFMTQNWRADRLIELTKHTSFLAGPRSFDWNENSNTLLVGTRGAEVYEITEDEQVKCHMHGHYNGEVWGLAVHPEDPSTFVSCGGDKTIRKWNVTDMLLASDEFEFDLKSADWSPDGRVIVCGGEEGHVYSVDASDLKQVDRITSKMNQKNKKCWIEDIKISPNNEKVVFGTHGGLSKVEVLQLTEDMKLKKFRTINVGMTSALLHIDWSSDSSSIVCNSQAYEIKFANIMDGSTISAPSARDIDWYTSTCKISWYTRGIFPDPDLTNVNIVCRSKNREYLATGEDSSLIKIFNFPAAQENAQFKEYKAHSSHVTEVRFSQGDNYLISTGGNDKTVLVWNTDWGQDAPAEEKEWAAAGQEEVEDFGDLPSDDDDEDDDDEVVGIVRGQEEIQRMKTKNKRQVEAPAPQEQDDDDGGLFQEEEVDAGDEFMSVQPWKGQMKPPTDFRQPQKDSNKAPFITGEIEWIHGYRARDSKNNVAILQDERVAYHAAAVGIVYDSNTHTQNHFIEHDDDITAFAFSEKKQLILTGEIGPRPKICLWNAETMTEAVKVKSKLKKGIQSLAFSPSGNTFCAVAIDTDHHVAIFDTETGTQLAMQKGGGQPILNVSMLSDTEFASSGVRHFNLWAQNNKSLKSKRGTLPRGKNTYSDKFCTQASLGSKYTLTGTVKGDFVVWSGTAVTKKSMKRMFDRPLDAIHVSEEYIFLGSRGGEMAVLLASSFELIAQFKDDKLESGINAFWYDNEKRLIIGTRGCDVLEFEYEGGKSIDFKATITNGHYSPCNKDLNEVWGLANFHTKDLYVTVSDDATMRVWDSLKREQVQCVDLNVDEKGDKLPNDPDTKEISNKAKARAVDVLADDKLVAVGFRDGHFRIYRTDNWKEVSRMNRSKEWIQDLKFSPDKRFLGVSSHDNKVYILSLPDLKKHGVCNKSSSFITQFDWSVDGRAIQTNDASYEILYYDDTGKQDTAGATNYRDEHWSTWTCILGWPVQGIWDPSLDGSDINSTSRSHHQVDDGYHLLAIGDDKGKVRVFRFPSVQEQSESLELKGHSSHVTRVKWGRDDKKLFSAGGNDTCIFQWKIEQKQQSLF